MSRTSIGPLALENRDSAVPPEAVRPSESPPPARIQLVKDLYEAHHSKVSSFLCRLVGPGPAADVTQEVFFRLLRVKNLERRVVTVSYLYRVGENLVRKSYHRDRRRREVMEDIRRLRKADETRSFGESTTHSGQVIIRAGDLGSAMNCLNDHEKSAINLIVCRGLSYEQAACSLGVSTSTINNWKHRGVNKLKEHLRIHASVDSERPAAGESDRHRSGHSCRSSGEQGENPCSPRCPGDPIRRADAVTTRGVLGRVG